MCESRAGRPGLPVPNKPTVSVDAKPHFTIFGRSARAQEVCKSRDGRPGLLAPNKPHGFCGLKATANQIIGRSARNPGEIKRTEVELELELELDCLAALLSATLLSGHCLCDLVSHSCLNST